MISSLVLARAELSGSAGGQGVSSNAVEPIAEYSIKEGDRQGGEGRQAF
jgi:hypothetical protein